ncbi:hypothetical protein JHK87_036951 [Glycine soja]|nr:hypothetical protein JHK87_036951 [Glycine soja]
MEEEKHGSGFDHATPKPEPNEAKHVAPIVSSYNHVHNGQNLIAKLKEKSIKHLTEVLEMEKLIDYTCNPEYMSEYNELMANQDKFVKIVNTSNYVVLDGFEQAIKVGHLTRYSTLLLQAFDLKMKLRAYCKIVLRRLMDSTALHLQLSIFNLVDKDLGDEIVKDTMSPYAGGIEKLLEEAPSVSMKRDKLNRNIKLLREIKGVVARFNMQ